METLLLFFFAGCGVLYWYTSQQCKQWAVHYARRECEKQQAQLLDQTVEQIKISMSRDSNNNWRFWREYRFEYSLDGVNRYEGRLVLLGKRLLRSVLETSDPIIH